MENNLAMIRSKNNIFLLGKPFLVILITCFLSCLVFNLYVYFKILKLDDHEISLFLDKLSVGTLKKAIFIFSSSLLVNVVTLFWILRFGVGKIESGKV